MSPPASAHRAARLPPRRPVPALAAVLAALAVSGAAPRQALAAEPLPEPPTRATAGAAPAPEDAARRTVGGGEGSGEKDRLEARLEILRRHVSSPEPSRLRDHPERLAIALSLPEQLAAAAAERP